MKRSNVKILYGMEFIIRPKLKKRYTVVLNKELFDYADEIAETMNMTLDEFIQKLVTEDLKHSMSLDHSQFSFDFNDQSSQSNKKTQKVFYCNQAENEACPHKFSFEDVDF
jgi:DNA-directed RNA polymerase specialized sigma subunit